MRSRAGGDPERVVVIESEGRREEPASAGETQIIVIDPVPLSAEHQAQAWLEDLLGEASRAVDEALAVVNRVVHLHRLAAADPRVSELTAGQATVARAGWGEGEQLADGRWTEARELPLQAAGRRRLFAPRLAAGTQRGARAPGAFRRADRRAPAAAAVRGADPARAAGPRAGRHALAALELRQALTTAVAELRGEGRQDLALRVDELEQLSGGVAAGGRSASSRRRAGRPSRAHERPRRRTASSSPTPSGAWGGAAGTPAARR